tara:strand:+ start:2001 stop:2453 length:453 start_codon:yes stop_codon:yes gene_type:complete
MIKKTIILLIFFSLAACGFKPIYTQKNDIKFIAKKIILEGDKKINRKIISIANLKEDQLKKEKNTLKIYSEKNIEAIAKDKKANISIYRTTITIIVTIEKQSKFIKTKTFSSSFNYNNLSNKFELSQYQKSIEKNLINKISQEIMIYLST